MNIFKKIPLIMKQVGAIEKNRKNSAPGQGGYAFRGIDDITEAFQPILAENGVFCVPEVLDHSREERTSRAGGSLTYTCMKIKHTFYADDGSSVYATTMGEAMDSGDKSSNKAMSAAFKYAFIETFCVPTTEEKDTEYQSPEVMPKAQRVQQQIASKPVPPMPEEIPCSDTPFENYGSNEHPLASYVIPSIAKRYQGKTLSQVPMKELADYASYMGDFLRKDGKEPRGAWIDLLNNIDSYVRGN